MLIPFCSARLPFIRGESWKGVSAEGGGRDSDELLRQILDLCVRRDVHHGVVCWEACRLQDCLHADVLDLPLPLSGNSVPYIHPDIPSQLSGTMNLLHYHDNFQGISTPSIVSSIFQA